MESWYDRGTCRSPLATPAGEYDVGPCSPVVPNCYIISARPSHPTPTVITIPPPLLATISILSHLALFPDSEPSDSAFSNGAGACSAITRSTARLSSKQND